MIDKEDLLSPMLLPVALAFSPSRKAVAIVEYFGSSSDIFVLEQPSGTPVYRLTLIRHLNEIPQYQEWEAGTQNARVTTQHIYQNWMLDLNQCIWHPLEWLFSL